MDYVAGEYQGNAETALFYGLLLQGVGLLGVNDVEEGAYGAGTGLGPGGIVESAEGLLGELAYLFVERHLRDEGVDAGIYLGCAALRSSLNGHGRGKREK